MITSRIQMNNRYVHMIVLFMTVIAFQFIPVHAQEVPQGIFAVAWSPDGMKIAGGGSDGQLRIWDAETGIVLQEFSGIDFAIRTVAWSPDGTRIASGGGDQIVRVWDTNGTLIWSTDVHDGFITSLGWSIDGTILASATHSGINDLSLRFWDGDTYQLIAERYAGDIYQFDWKPVSTQYQLGVANENGYVSIGELVGDQFQSTGLKYENNVPMTSVSWASDGNRLASGDSSGSIRIWNSSDFSNIGILSGHIDVIESVVWDPTNTYLASASSDGTIRVWNVVSQETIAVFQKPTNHTTNAIDWNSIGLILGQQDGTVKIIKFPNANAGTDQTISTLNSTASVTLDGSGSSDVDGSIVSYAWTDSTGAQVATGVSPTVDLSVGEHTLTLTVTDDDGATASDEVVITIQSLPIADAGADQTVNAISGSASVMLDGSASSDADGSIVSYSWTDSSATEIATGETPTVSLLVGVHTLTLTVTDNDDYTASDDVVITVQGSPIADAGPDQYINSSKNNIRVKLDGSGSTYTTRPIVSYIWTDDSGVELASGINPTIGLSGGATYVITLTVTDEDGYTDTDDVIIDIWGIPIILTPQSTNP